MASVYSCYVASLRFPSDPSDQLAQSPRAGHEFYSPYYIPDSSLTAELIRLLIATIVQLVSAMHLTPSWNCGK